LDAQDPIERLEGAAHRASGTGLEIDHRGESVGDPSDLAPAGEGRDHADHQDEPQADRGDPTLAPRAARHA